MIISPYYVKYDIIRGVTMNILYIIKGSYCISGNYIAYFQSLKGRLMCYILI